MKRKLLFIIVLALLAGNVVHAQYIEDTVYAYRTEAAPLIDGDIDAEWDGAPFVTITYWGREDGILNPVPDEADFKADFKMMWDDEYAYFLGVCVDDIVCDMANASDAGAYDWESDSWEFYIAPTMTKLEDMTEMTQIRLGYANATTENVAAVTVNGWSAGGFTLDDFCNADRKLSDDGWVVEARFDLAAFATASAGYEDIYELGGEIGWGITVSDRDEEASRDDIGSFTVDTQWDEADTLSILKLTEAYVAAIDNTTVGSEISFYPNPVAQELHISSAFDIERVEVVNTVGAMVLRRSNVADRIDVSDLHTGLYFVKVYSEGYLRKTHKFFKE